jgi:hypothetical protein
MSNVFTKIRRSDSIIDNDATGNVFSASTKKRNGEALSTSPFRSGGQMFVSVTEFQGGFRRQFADLVKHITHAIHWRRFNLGAASEHRCR